MSRSPNSQQHAAILRIRLVDKKVFKKFTLFLNKTVKEARITIAKEVGVDPEQYGLFLPPKEEQAGKWCRDDYPLSFYGLEGEKESKEAHLMTNPATVEYFEFKKRFRPVRIVVSSGATTATRAVTVDDTKRVSEVIKDITDQVGTSPIIDEDELFSMHEDEYELLSNDMTIREQGFLGECTMGIYKNKRDREIGLYVKVPYAEGWILRKRGGGVLKGLKNWNKRWYVLKKNKIMYFKSKAGVGQEPLGSIPIKNIIQVKQSELTDLPTKYEQYCFEIVTPARIFVMLTLTETEFCSWMTHLDTARRMFANETIFLSPLHTETSLAALNGTSGANSSNTNNNKTTTQQQNQQNQQQNQQQKNNNVNNGNTGNNGNNNTNKEEIRRMTLVILSEDDPANVSPATEKRNQLLKRVQTAPTLSVQQNVLKSAAQSRMSPPKPSPGQVAGVRSPRQHSASTPVLQKQLNPRTPRGTTSTAPTSPTITSAPTTPTISSAPTSPTLALSPITTTSSRSSPPPPITLTPATPRDAPTPAPPPSSAATKTPPTPTTTTPSASPKVSPTLTAVTPSPKASPSPPITTSPSQLTPATTPTLTLDRASPDLPEFVTSESMENDSPKLQIDSPNLSRIGSFVHESSFVRDVIESLPTDSPSAPTIVLNGEQLFSDSMSVERIGDEWLGPSYGNDVDLRDDFSNQTAINQSAEFSLIKSTSFFEDLADTAGFAPATTSFVFSSSPNISSEIFKDPSLNTSLEISKDSSPTVPLEISQYNDSPFTLSPVPTKKETAPLPSEPTPASIPEPTPSEPTTPHEFSEPTPPAPGLLPESTPVTSSPKLAPLSIPTSNSTPTSTPTPTSTATPTFTPTPVPTTSLPTSPATSPTSLSTPKFPPLSTSTSPSTTPKASIPPIPLESSVKSVQSSPRATTNVKQPSSLPSPVQSPSPSPSPSPAPSPRPLPSPRSSPRVQSIPDEEPTEQDAEFIKENEQLKYLFYEPRAVRVRAEMLRTWANYIFQKGGDEPVTDWVVAHKQLEPKPLSQKASHAYPTRPVSLLGAAAESQTGFPNLIRGLRIYLQLLHHLDAEAVPTALLQENSVDARAKELVRILSDLGFKGLSMNQLLKGDFKVHKDILLAIYESVGTESLHELYYDIISRRNASCRFINSTMKDEPTVVNIVPFHPLYTLKVLSDGTILCHLINKVFPGTIDTQLIASVKRILHPSGVPRGVLLALHAARAIGANVAHIKVIEWTDPNKKVRMLHELIWSVVEVCGLKCARPVHNPNLAPLQRRDEDTSSFNSLSPEAILMRWFNHHLRKRSLRHINNLSDDLEDGENYVLLLESIAPGHISRKQALAEQDWEKRATAILRTAKLIGCRMLITPRDISEAENGRLGPLFVAELLRIRPGFSKQDLDEAANVQASQSKEIRAEVAFADIIPWIDSLDLGIEIQDASAFKDGTVLLKILDAIAPGAVDPKWLKVEPKGSRFKMVELANKTLEIASAMKINTTNIGGVDLVNGDVRPTVALLNQFSRYRKADTKSTTTTTTATGPRKGSTTTTPQAMALAWANAQVAAHGKTTKLMSFKDHALRDGRFLLDLVSSLYPKVVNQAAVTPGQTDAEQEQNARYLLSLVWSLGIPVAILWSDIVSVRSSAIKELLETLHNHYDEKMKTTRSF